MSTVNDIPDPVVSQRGEPVWEIARLFPPQGDWTEDAYFSIESTRLVELVDGCLEFPPMPTKYHQRVVQFLFGLLSRFVSENVGGEVFFAPLPVRLWPGRIREPDIVYLSAEKNVQEEDYPQSADLVIEVVSKGPESRKRDLEQKRSDYAEAKIPEYWIVDPQQKQITVLVLVAEEYQTHGVFGPGDSAPSALLKGFSVQVDDVWSAASRSASN